LGKLCGLTTQGGLQLTTYKEGKKMRRKIRMIGLSVFCFLLMSAIGSLTVLDTEASSPPKTIKIGGAVSFTGRFASGGLESKFGYEQAVADINKEGGVYVKEFNKKIPLELIIEDDESDSTKCVARLEKMHSVDNVVAYLGPYGSTLCAAAAGIAEKNRVPILAVSFSLLAPHQQGYKYLFSPFVKTDTGVEAIFATIDTIPKAQRPGTVAIFAEKTDWGEELTRLTPDIAKKRGYTVVVEKSYAVGTKDYSSLIIAAKSANAEIVIGVPTPPDGIAIMRQIKELDYNPKVVIFWRAAGTPLWAANLKQDGDYVGYVSNWDHNFKYPGCAELVAAYKAKHNNKLPAVTVGVTYSCVQILADAIKRAGTLDRNKIRDAIAATNMTTVQGPVKFRPDGVGITPVAIMQWQKGMSQVIYHEKFTTSPLLLMPKWSERK
jgi:branched-chain amino acid transport system substrate-binding protein